METRDSRRRRRTGIALAVDAALVFLLVFSLLASSAIAVPLSRSLKSLDAPLNVAESFAQGGWRGLFGGYEGRKLRVEINDYDGTGANNKHDPIPRS